MTVTALKPAPKLFAYKVSPIDYWDGWIPEQEFLVRLQEQLTDGYALGRRDEYAKLKRQGMELAKKVGWEGDIRDGPFVAALPNGDCESDLMIAWKQDEDGTTFIVSPFRLPWLEQWPVEKAVA